MTDIDDRLISWYLDCKRALPWRETRDPYLIWLSEIILQQTRVAQGLSYYHKFAQAYPTVELLAAASEQEVLKMWQGLGYYSRARNLRASAIHITDALCGVFPHTYEDILKLKGIGPYTAAAIASFAFKIPKAVVDGNVNRVIARLFNLDIPVDSTLGKKTIQQIADELISQRHPDLFNQGIMELGAMICTPTKPSCITCPLSHHCESRKRKTIEERPVKTPKRKPVDRPIHYIVLDNGSSLIMKLRSGKDIWTGLWDFPELKGVSNPGPGDVRQFIKNEFPNIGYVKVQETYSKTYKHLLTHQRIQSYFWICVSRIDSKDKSVYLSVSKKDLEELAVPRLIHKFLIDFSFLT